MQSPTGNATYRIAYLSLQAVVEGQDTWAAVGEVIRGMRDAGCIVDEWFVKYPPSTIPGPMARLAQMWDVQRRLGTAQERDDDFERVRKAAHRLNNMLCAALLAEKMDRF